MEIEALLRKMSLREKVGQMFMLAFAGQQLDQARTLVQEHGIGACYLSQENAATPEQALDLAATLQGFARSTRWRIPLLLGADQEGAWGVLVPTSTTGPGNLALGAAGSPELTREMYQVIGTELAAVGYNTLLAPCADVNSRPSNPIIGARSFGQDPAQVAELVAAAVQGAHAGGVIASVKHFPGHGDTAVDSHRGLPQVERNREELERCELPPFRAAIAAGVDIVMTSHILFPALDPAQPATLSAPILQQLLREELGFQGLILSDSMNMGAMRKNYAPDEAAVLAVQAGVDMILLAEEYYDHDAESYIEKQLSCLRGVIEAVESGHIAMSRIDEAVRRVLELKKRYGLFASRRRRTAVAKIVGAPAHRAVERRAAAAAVCLVQSTGNVLPLPADARVVLVNATPRASYKVLDQTRGIGPNQSVPAFDTFAEHLLAARPDVQVLSYEMVALAPDLPDAIHDADVVLVVTENYPLPGLDFDTWEQMTMVIRLIMVCDERLALVGLRDPYELSRFSDVPTYLCSCSSRPCAARAAADVVLGRSQPSGRLPVSVADN